MPKETPPQPTPESEPKVLDISDKVEAIFDSGEYEQLDELLGSKEVKNAPMLTLTLNYRSLDCY